MRDSDPKPLAQSLYVRDLDPLAQSKSTSLVNIIFQNLKNYFKAYNKIRPHLKTHEKDFQHNQLLTIYQSVHITYFT